MKKKRILAAAMGAALAASLAGCAGGSSAAATPQTQATADTAATEETSEEAAEQTGETAVSADTGTLTVNGGAEIPISSLEYRTDSQDAPVVYFISDITPEALAGIYEAL